MNDPAQVRSDLAVILGAGVRPDGTPTTLLARRVEAGVALFEQGRVASLVMSGADVGGGDEPAAMAQRARELGVPADRVAVDHTGVDTAATCHRLAINHQEASIVLVTQQFHARRTAYLAAKAGLEAVVLATPDADVRLVPRYKARAREFPASIKALVVDRF